MLLGSLLPTESQEQMALFEWAEMYKREYPELQLMYHIPNGGYRTKAEAGRFKAEGVKAGVPDIFLPVSRGGFHGLYIELKRMGRSGISDAQRKWLAALSEQGYKTVVCKGWQEAAGALSRYLKAGGSHVIH